jgi:hypothetical protein
VTISGAGFLCVRAAWLGSADADAMRAGPSSAPRDGLLWARYVIRIPCVFRAHTTRIYGASHTAARSQDLLVTYADSISCVSKCRFVSYSSRSHVGYFHRSFALQARAVSGLAHTRQARANRAFSSQPATLRVGLTPVTWSVSRSEDTSQCMHAPRSRGGAGLGVCLLYLPSPVSDRQNALYYNHYNAWE